MQVGNPPKRNVARRQGARAVLRKALEQQTAITIENTRLLNELRESLQRQTATADVLKAISRSTFDLQAVLDTLVESAARLCEAETSFLFRRDGANFIWTAGYGHTPEYLEQWKDRAVPPSRGSAVGRAAAEGKIVHIADVFEDPEYTRWDSQKACGYRSVLGVPLLREGIPIGVLGLTGSKPQSFSDQHIELVTTFADQAVIAIENVRLFEAAQQRTRELTELLQQQTAITEILRVISNSPNDVQPVLDSVAEYAARICESQIVQILLAEDDKLRIAATFGQFQRPAGLPLDRSTVSGRSVYDRQSVHIADLQNASDEFALGRELAIKYGHRSTLAVPLIREGRALGTILVLRTEVRPFEQKHIALLTTFADQAAIAIENVRLFEAEQQRTRELRELLEQQTATSKVLDVISRSAFDLHAVFEAVVESSVRLCGAERGFIYRFDGELLRMAVGFNVSQELREFAERNPIRPGRKSAAARAALERRTIHIPDAFADPEYTYGAKDVGRFRTVLGVPILKGDDLQGVIIIHPQDGVRPFTDTQIALVETFADQAAIAIENVRLLDELRQRTDELCRSVEELRALGEVSQAVNSTLDLETVLSTIVGKAVQLSGTEAGAIYVFDNRQHKFHLRATYGMDRELIDALTRADMGVNEPNIALILAGRELIQVADLKEEAPSDLNEITLRAGYRARLVAPLIRGEDVVGLLVVRRKTWSLPAEYRRFDEDFCGAVGRSDRERALIP